MVEKWAVQNLKIKIVLDDTKILIGTVNMVGFDRFSDFIEKDNSKFLKLTNVTLGGTNYPFMMLNKFKILGYLPL